MSGNVYNEEGATVDGALVTVKSLDASVPYTATATTAQGSYVVNNVPEGANVEIVATKGGWTSRRRVGSFQQQATGQRNLINFGSAGGTVVTSSDNNDPTGAAYFISNYPEIASTEPVSDATGVDNSKLTFKVRLSEPLDEDSRDNLADALTIIPANESAAGEATDPDPVDFETREDVDVADGTHDVFDTLGTAATGDDTIMFNLTNTGAAPTPRTSTLLAFGYAVEEGSTFLGNTNRKAAVTWNAEGTEMTFSFDATLLASKNDEAKYQAVLVSRGTGSDEKIDDADNNQLGTDSTGSLRAYPAAGMIIANAFKEVDLSIAEKLRNAGDTADITDRKTVNWASTHDSAVNYEIKRDETRPTLTAVDVSKNVNGNFRIELTFSEGMAAFNGSQAGKYDQTNLENLVANARFVLGDKVGDTEDIDLSDSNDPKIDLLPATTHATFGATGDMEKEFTFAAAEVQTYSATENGGSTTDVTNIDDADLATGEVFVEVDDNNPNIVFIWIKNRANYFGNIASELKAYVKNVQDPAGNAIRDTDAKNNQVRASI